MGNSRPESKNPHKTMILWGFLLFLDMSREEFLADRGGFEPPIRLSRIHAFQACAFNHSATCPDLERTGLATGLAGQGANANPRF